MGLLDYVGGFAVTAGKLVKSTESGRTVTVPYVKDAGPQAGEAGAPPRPPRAQPLRGRHGEVHRLRALRRCLPRPLHLRARRRQPARRPGLAGRALRLRLRDQLPALHPLRPVRRGLPDRGHHRVASSSSSPSPTASDAIYTKAELVVDDDGLPAAAALGGLERPGRGGRPDLGLGAGHRAVGQRRLRGPRRLVGRARLRREAARGRPAGRGRRPRGRAPRPRPPTAAATTTTTTTTTAGVTTDAVELFVFAVAGAVCLAGAVGVVAQRATRCTPPCRWSATLFGIAVLFVAQEANFLAAVQVIVYAGAIVVLFLFVIMLLGVDRAEDLQVEPIGGQRVAAVIVAAAILALPIVAIATTDFEATGARPAEAGIDRPTGQVIEADSNRIDAGNGRRRAARRVALHRLPLRLRDHLGAPRDRRRRRRRPRPQGQAGRLDRRPARAAAAEPDAEPEPTPRWPHDRSPRSRPAWYLVLGVDAVRHRRRSGCWSAATRW